MTSLSSEHLNEELTEQIQTGANALTEVVTTSSGENLLQKWETAVLACSDFIGDQIMERVLTKYLPNSYQFYNDDHFELELDGRSPQHNIYNVKYRRLLHTAAHYHTWTKHDYSTHNMIEMSIMALVDSVALIADRFSILGTYYNEGLEMTLGWSLSRLNTANIMVHSKKGETVIIPIDNGWGGYLVHRTPAAHHMQEINLVLSQIHQTFFKDPEKFAHTFVGNNEFLLPKGLDHNQLDQYAKVMSAFWRQFGVDICADIFGFMNDAVQAIERKYSDAPWYEHNNHQMRKKLKWMYGIVSQNAKNCKDLKGKISEAELQSAAFKMANPKIPSEPWPGSVVSHAHVDYYNNLYGINEQHYEQSNVNFLDYNNYYLKTFLFIGLDLLLMFGVILFLIVLAICIGVYILIKKKQSKNRKNRNTACLHESV